MFRSIRFASGAKSKLGEYIIFADWSKRRDRTYHMLNMASHSACARSWILLRWFCAACLGVLWSLDFITWQSLFGGCPEMFMTFADCNARINMDSLLWNFGIVHKQQLHTPERSKCIVLSPYPTSTFCRKQKKRSECAETFRLTWTDQRFQVLFSRIWFLRFSMRTKWSTAASAICCWKRRGSSCVGFWLYHIVPY